MRTFNQTDYNRFFQDDSETREYTNVVDAKEEYEDNYDELDKRIPLMTSVSNAVRDARDEVKSDESDRTEMAHINKIDIEIEPGRLVEDKSELMPVWQRVAIEFRKPG